MPNALLITGATGFIGARLATLALESGTVVKTLTRTDWDTAPAVPLANRYFGSLPAQIPAEAFLETTSVVHCAVETGTGERSSQAVNVEGTLRLARAARDAGVTNFIFLSSQAARAGAISAYGRTKYAAEQALVAMGGINVIILRPGLVTGPGVRGLYRRLVRTLERLPVVPLLAGGRTIVQPIHVDDLCAAIFRCIALGPHLAGQVLCLGDPEGETLANFLQAVALAHLGRRKPTVAIPLQPVEWMVALAEAMGLTLPINRNNLRGLKVVERMDTRADMESLGLTLRPLAEAVKPSAAADGGALPLSARPVRTLLVGAGRIGLLHSVVLSRLRGHKLTGLVDPKPSATALLQRMGLAVPAFRDLGAAQRATRSDAAVIATPAATHLALAERCLQQGLVVMVEKPLAIQPEQLADFVRLQEAFPQQPIQAGYVAPRNPQIAASLERLKRGDYGRVLSFTGFSLLSLIQTHDSGRWETKRAQSGGGVLINSGGHVLSLIQAAFGDPQSLQAQSARLYSVEVEDSLIVHFEYPGFSGKHYCSWSISGYPRQENRLVIHTERGCLLLTLSASVFQPNDGPLQIEHQLDFEVGFNLTPDFGGGGFTTELLDLREAVLTRRPPPMDVRTAAQLERLLFQIYASVTEVTTFTVSVAETPTNVPEPVLHRPVVRTKPAGCARLLDLRELSPAAARTWLSTRPLGHWDGAALLPAQVASLPGAAAARAGLRVTVPDFLAQTRLLSTGQYGPVLRQMGLPGIVGAARAVLPLVPRERGLTFWLAAAGLLGAALQRVPADFDGTLLLHTYLTDIALGLRQLDRLDSLLNMCRQMRPAARVGFQTNLAAEALDALWRLEARVDEVSVLSSPGAPALTDTLREMRQVSAWPLTLLAEVGLAPEHVHAAAALEPERWAQGADAVLIGLGGEPELARPRRSEHASTWARAFPGAAAPWGAL